ncbi:nitroreductase [Leclercia adecarboxylata]|uniref:nitroreductase n=1 Tax=Leclercia adecarboxylata TaxID=83655 RepID=UPI002DB66049|nr:nitroreductase [Leclercia adecarboxylata]MEB6381564.1 nitroreductase [Leclercia adecarboxylata]
MSNSMLFQDVVRERHSMRAFLPHPVPEDTLRSVLEDAQHSPSNCNTQPWQTHIVSGSKRDALSKAILAADEAGQLTPDFSFGINDFPGVYRERYKEQGAAYYQAIGVKRDDYDLRRDASRRNLEFFGAPHVALLFMPEVGDNVRVAGDIGMYAQTLLLSLTAHGLGGVPQTMLGFYGETIRKELGIDPSLKLLFGISLGYPDMTHPANQYRINKAPVGESVTFHK